MIDPEAPENKVVVVEIRNGEIYDLELPVGVTLVMHYSNEQNPCLWCQQKD